jgi:hypothetical protein
MAHQVNATAKDIGGSAEAKNNIRAGADRTDFVESAGLKSKGPLGAALCADTIGWWPLDG